MRDTVADLAIYDRAYWLKAREGNQAVILRIPPASLVVDAATGAPAEKGADGKLCVYQR